MARRNALGQEYSTVNLCACSDDRRSTKYGRTGIDSDVILKRGMSLGSAKQLPLVIPFEDSRAKRDALIDPAMAADDRCLADDDARTVINEETVADASTRMYVDPGDRVSVFGHHSRDQWNLETVQAVGDPVDP